MITDASLAVLELFLDPPFRNVRCAMEYVAHDLVSICAEDFCLVIIEGRSGFLARLAQAADPQ